MNCKCGELKKWLSCEISHLEKMKKELSEQSKLHSILSGKIESYSIVLEGLE